MGRVTGPYRFDPESEPEAPHRHAVDWLSLNTWEFPESEGLRTTVLQIDEPKNVLEAESYAAFPPSVTSVPSAPAISARAPAPLPLNIILYGPPGTGKTYRLRNEFMEKFFTDRQAVLSPDEQASALVKDMAWWEVIALALLDAKDHRASVAQILEHPLVRARLKLSANKNPRAMLWASLQSHTKKDCRTVNYTTRIDPLIFSKDEDSVWHIDAKLAETETPELGQALQQFRYPAKEVPEVCRYKFTTFHQSFSYEDFVEGIKPQSDGGQISYEVRDGIFKKACQEAAANPDKAMSARLEAEHREGLRTDVTVVPVGGLDKLVTFIALLGASGLKLAVLHDYGAPAQKLADLAKQKLIQPKALLNAAQFRDLLKLGQAHKPSDIEDLFEPSLYLDQFNGAFKTKIAESDLPPGDRIVERLERHLSEKGPKVRPSGGFNHYLVASHFASNPPATLSPDTLSRYEAMFKAINQLF